MGRSSSPRCGQAPGHPQSRARRLPLGSRQRLGNAEPSHRAGSGLEENKPGGLCLYPLVRVSNRNIFWKLFFFNYLNNVDSPKNKEHF